MMELETTTRAPLDDLAAALAAFQAEMPTVVKSQTARVRTRDGDSYSYTYAGLAQVTEAAMPLLSKHGLAFVTLPGEGQLVGMLIHKSGQTLTAQLPIGGGSPQQLGSSLTYMRRYLLGCMTGLVTDDDDDGRQAEQTRKRPSDTGTQARKTVRTRQARQALLETGSAETVKLPDTPQPEQPLEPRPPVAPAPPPITPDRQQVSQGGGPNEPDTRMVTGIQRGQLMATCSRIGIDPEQDREMRLALWSALLARPVDSIKSLSHTEANTLLRYLNDIEHGALEWDYHLPQNVVTLRWAKGK